MITKKVIVTNNKKAYEKYHKTAEVYYMEGADPHEVFSKVMELLENGARLSDPNIDDVFSYYRTVGLFYGDENAPIKRNLDTLKKALHDTYDISAKKPIFSNMAQLADLKRCRMSKKALPGEERKEIFEQRKTGSEKETVA